MRPSSRSTGSAAVWTTLGSASISAKTRSAADRPSWNWLQKEAMLISGHQKKPTACMNRYQLPGLMPPPRVASPPA